MPVGIKGVVIVGVVSAVMSTADSFLHAAVVSLTHDVIKPLSPTLSEKNEFFLLKILTIVLGCFSLMAALAVENLIELCLLAWTFWSPLLLFPIIMALYGKSISTKLFLITSCLGGGTALIWKVFFSSSLISPLVLGVLVNMVAFYGFYKLKNAH